MYRVMIIDDEEPVLDSFSFIFKKYVTDFALCGQARSGTEAIKEITEKSPDLVFMDIQMPGLDGIEVIKQLRPLFPNMVFILSTAYERFDIAQKAIRLGVFSYLIKPVSRNKVLEELDKVKDYLDIRKKNSENKLEDVQLLEKTRSEMQKSFLSTLIWNNPQKKEWDEFAKVFSINCDKAAIYLIGGISHISLDVRADRIIVILPLFLFAILYRRERNCRGEDKVNDFVVCILHPSKSGCFSDRRKHRQLLTIP